MKKWEIDKIHSTIGFEVTHMMVSKVRGEFTSFNAKIEAEDLTNLTHARVEFKIDAASITTRYHERDNHLKSADFFDIQHYPFIYFQSTQTKKSQQDGQYQIKGDLTIKETTKQVIFDVMSSGKAVSPEGEAVYGFEAETVINREEFGLLWNAILETGGVLVGNEVTIKVDLEIRTENLSKVNQISPEKQSDQRQDSNDLWINNNFYQIITENLSELVVLIDHNGIIKYANPSFKNKLGNAEGSKKRQNFFDIVHPEEVKSLKEEIDSYVKKTIKTSFETEFRLRDHEGYYKDFKTDIIFAKDHDFLQLVMRDISEQKATEEAIFQLAFYDTLTGLPNRRSFHNELRNAVMECKHTTSILSVLFIDLDDFKQINDQWGHDAGDTALKEAANRICSVIRPTDIAARYGGDEFVVLLKDVPNEAYTINIVEKILEQFNEPIVEQGKGYFLTLSIGAAHYPAHGQSPETLINNADTALYHVKDRGKNDYMIFNEMIEHQSLERRILENALRQGLKDEQFYLVYQPKVNITKNQIIGMEALVRWNHPEFGVIPPNKFIPLAEETGLIISLGEWILRESCRQATEWEKLYDSSLNISVNISVRQLEDPNFIEKVQTILEETGIEPSRLEFEITESVLANIESTVSILKEIRDLGVLISVDDFGTGYSSLSYIKELPVDTIKIDRSFVQDIHTNKESKEIAKAIINLANSIGLNAIAEGIEQKEHVEELMDNGCLMGQGYYYSKPLKVDEFENFMKKKHDVS